MYIQPIIQVLTNKFAFFEGFQNSLVKWENIEFNFENAFDGTYFRCPETGTYLFNFGASPSFSSYYQVYLCYQGRQMTLTPSMTSVYSKTVKLRKSDNVSLGWLQVKSGPYYVISMSYATYHETYRKHFIRLMVEIFMTEIRIHCQIHYSLPFISKAN